MNAACTSEPGTRVPSNSRSGAAHASCTTVAFEPLIDRRADGRIDAHAAHHPGDHEVVDAAGAKLLGEIGLDEPVRAVLLDHSLALDGGDQGMDLGALRAGT